ncbi:uncharacterized protein LOC133201277 [Saccostrea echinata]|uniref:uncharacterized protein LOC133201277 n=1 Tax=Saccostrea echinata TaxID=191078 RepID=UPI002A817B2D|nr:uncharacterized protein LOC133201277 [Saccostrea echinata]
MEKEGFIRSTNHIQERGIKIKGIITDRHVQIVKHIREEMPETVHHFDVWHVAKGLKKKLTAMSKEKGYEQLQEWIRSICNHLYWSAASTPDGNGQLLLKKWQSVANHVQNIHEHDGELYNTCPHGPLEGIERHKKWLKPGSKLTEKFSDLVFSNQMKKDVPKLSPGSQTAALEGFHAVVNHFAPKMIGFSYHGMLSRLILAALHFNENGMREQATTKEGKKRFDVVFPKYKKGEYTVREVKVECTYGYVKKLMSAVEERASQFSMNSSIVVQRQPAPPPLCSVYHHPDKTKAVEEKPSRFNQSHNFEDDDSSACC